MRGVKRCQESLGRMKKHRYSNEFKVAAVKMAIGPDIETKAVADALNICPSCSRAGKTREAGASHYADQHLSATGGSREP